MENQFDFYQSSARWNFPNCRPSNETDSSADDASCGKTNKSSNRNSADAFQNKSLAMAYVPWQRWDTVYKEDVGLERGTIFPELDLPFLGEEVM